MRYLAATLVLLAAPLSAQTQGVPGINDYTVGCFGCIPFTSICDQVSSLGGTSGTTTGDPGTKLLFDATLGGTLTFSVDGAPGNSAVFIYYNVAECASVPTPLAKLTYGLNATTNFPLTNQTIDLALSPPPTLLLSGVTNPVGDFAVAIPITPMTAGCTKICTQALILDLGAVTSGFVVSQAYEITFV